MRGGCSIGIDFGTTNTVIARARPGETVRAIAFRDDRELSDLYRSMLCFERLSASRHDIEAQAGSKAIRAYLSSVYETRFIQSVKSHVASPLFDVTRIFGRGYKFENLLSVFFGMRSPMPTASSPNPTAAWFRGGRSRLSAQRRTRR
jgi:hypothetical chaperone protein